MQDTMFISLLMDIVTTTFKGVFIAVPIVSSHSTKDVITGFGYLLLVSLVNIPGQLSSTFTVNGVVSPDFTATIDRVTHQIAL